VAAEQGDEADKAWVNFGASQLIPGVRRTTPNWMRVPERLTMMRIAFLVVLAMLPSAGVPAQSVGDLTGKYYSGAPLGPWVHLSLRPDGTYTYTCDTDVGHLGDREGQIELAGTSLTLVATGTPGTEPDPFVPSQLVVVRWSDRVYLVFRDAGPLFAAYVTRGQEPRTTEYGWFRFLLREGDWNKPARGLPELPEQWRKWLLVTPVEARVTRTIARHRAEIDAGARQKLEPDMLLNLVSKKYGSTDVRVVSVAKDSSVIENDYGDPPLLVGGRVTSRGR
jgi:hypothetical protein